MIALNLNVPTSLTKQLKISTSGNGRKLRVSSNFLPLFGFEKDARIEAVPFNGAVRITTKENGPQKIYSREYKHRSNNPTETVLELSNLQVMQQFPSYVERFHVQMKRGEILLSPLANLAFSVRSALRKLENPLQMFAALTSGVDIHAAKNLGFHIKGIVEYRPQEARDSNDLTETGVLTALANNKIDHVFNEDIYSLNWRNVVDLLDMPHVPVVHASLQCDHFSNLCPKDVATSYDLNNTRDMFIPFLEGVKALKPAVVMIEQVAGFQSSNEWQLLSMQLRRMGYIITEEVMDARDQGGLTSRSRMHSVCSLFPGFEMPGKVGRRSEAIWDEIVVPYLHECRDVTHSNAIQTGAKTGRLRVLSKLKAHSPTPVKSQARMAKDSLVIEHEGKYLMPSEALLKKLMAIPEDFNLDVVGSTIASEIIGQSVDYGMHTRILASIKDHLIKNLGECVVTNYQHQAGRNLDLFLN